MPKRLIAALSVTLAICLAGLGYLVATHPALSPAGEDGGSAPAGVAGEGLGLGGDFTLTAHTGARVASSDFAGKHLLIFFGYTFCPDICPFTLQTISAALDRLPAEDAARIQPLFITADPERDTPEVLAAYVGHFHPSVIGLTGTPEEIAAVAEAFRASISKAPPADGDPDNYLVNHSSFVYVVDPEGAVERILRHDLTAEEMAAAFAAALET